jgi:hypothetical protein
MLEQDQLTVDAGVQSGELPKAPEEGAPQDTTSAGDSGGSRSRERILELVGQRDAHKAREEALAEELRLEREKREELFLQLLTRRQDRVEPTPDPNDVEAVLKHGQSQLSRQMAETQAELGRLRFERDRDRAVAEAMNGLQLTPRQAARVQALLAQSYAANPKAALRKEAVALLEDLGVATTKGAPAPQAPKVVSAEYAEEKKRQAASVAAPKPASGAPAPAPQAAAPAAPSGPYNPRVQKASILAGIREGAMAMVRAAGGGQ